MQGKNCNSCQPEHYGLSMNDTLGCQPCNCDIGGAHDNKCDKVTGQCRCRPNIHGRHCNDVPSGHFIVGLDFLLFKGQHDTGSTTPVRC
jgi:hypothetical protein